MSKLLRLYHSPATPANAGTDASPMSPEQHQLLTLSILPARLNAEQAAQLLGFQAHDLTTLIAAGLLRPLGRPAANSTKYFAAVEVERLRSDLQWLSKATDAVQRRWRQKNRTEPDRAAQGQRLNGAGQRTRLARRPASAEPLLPPNP